MNIEIKSASKCPALNELITVINETAEPAQFYLLCCYHRPWKCWGQTTDPTNLTAVFQTGLSDTLSNGTNSIPLLPWNPGTATLDIFSVAKFRHSSGGSHEVIQAFPTQEEAQLFLFPELQTSPLLIQFYVE